MKQVQLNLCLEYIGMVLMKEDEYKKKNGKLIRKLALFNRWFLLADPFSAALPSPLPSALLPPHSAALSSISTNSMDGNYLFVISSS